LLRISKYLIFDEVKQLDKSKAKYRSWRWRLSYCLIVLVGVIGGKGEPMHNWEKKSWHT